MTRREVVARRGLQRRDEPLRERGRVQLKAHPFAWAMSWFATLQWAAWFNTCRLMEPLGYLPPAEYEAQYDRRGAARAMAGALN